MRYNMRLQLITLLLLTISSNAIAKTPKVKNKYYYTEVFIRDFPFNKKPELGCLAKSEVRYNKHWSSDTFKDREELYNHLKETFESRNLRVRLYKDGVSYYQLDLKNHEWTFIYKYHNSFDGAYEWCKKETKKLESYKYRKQLTKGI